MPTFGCDDTRERMARRRQAEAQVRAKVPTLIEGSSGWHRALANRLRRL